MTRYRLHSASPEFSRIAAGTWRMLSSPDTATPAGAAAFLRGCLECGITTVDTAEIYGGYRVEEMIGAALREDAGLRGQLEIITKAGIYVPNDFHPDRRTAHYNASGARLVKSAEKSLRFLGLEAIDLFLVHRPDWMASVDDTAEGLTRLMSEGKIRSAGVSNYSAAQFRALQSRLAFPLVTNQVEFSPFHMDPIGDGVFDLCQEVRTAPMAWSPTGGGRLFDEGNETAGRLRAAMQEMSGRCNGAGVDQLCFAWILAHPSRPMPVTGSNRVERIQAAAAAVDIVLERQDWYAVWEAAHGHRIP